VGTAISLALAGATTLDRETILRAYLRALAEHYRRWTAAQGEPTDSGLGVAYRQMCSTIGQQVQLHLPGRQPLLGHCAGVDDEGRLLVRDLAGRTQPFAAGDVVHVRPH
jgi:BirA family biotin operon repressor/biotin-[acetyl-CoA-carboxylase] ligase